MPRFIPLLMTVCLASHAASAHENQSEIQNQGDRTCITSNGTPSHAMGRFPNRANPNAFRQQTLTFCFPSTPQLAPSITEGLMTVGVSLTGIPFRPYTAGYYDPNGRRGIGRTPSDWRQQAMHEPRKLGMDANNAHVDRSGLYHYHGVSEDYLAAQNGTLIGYAPDGFEIHYDPDVATSSWVLKSGTRPTDPFGAYSGEFEEDFEYNDNAAGSLDECNGTLVNGAFRYYATDNYPFFPRCFKGVVEDHFMRRR